MDLAKKLNAMRTTVDKLHQQLCCLMGEQLKVQQQKEKEELQKNMENKNQNPLAPHKQ